MQRHTKTQDLVALVFGSKKRDVKREILSK